ncbi:MAG TPA: hypothetical protein VLI90_09395 [Tepidisphaeraceae bacterium]|nr:hypothetical protein [Tepidisphaeraceae bacterium]
MSEAETNIVEDGEAPLPVLKVDEDPPAVLAYANLRGAQPAHSRFVCQRHTDGSVTLMEPPDLSQSLGTRVAGVLAVLLAIAWVIWLLYDLLRTRWQLIWPAVIIAPLVLAALGMLLWLEGRYAARQPLVIKARPGEIIVHHRTMLRFGRRSVLRGRRLGRIVVPLGSPSLKSMRMHSSVYVSPVLGLATPLLANRRMSACGSRRF